MSPRSKEDMEKAAAMLRKDLEVVRPDRLRFVQGQLDGILFALGENAQLG